MMTTQIINGIKIRTYHVFPPIAVRAFDWSATTEDYDGSPESNDPVGRGPTEQAAIDDLMDQIADAAEQGSADL